MVIYLKQAMTFLTYDEGKHIFKMNQLPPSPNKLYEVKIDLTDVDGEKTTYIVGIKGICSQEEQEDQYGLLLGEINPGLVPYIHKMYSNGTLDI